MVPKVVSSKIHQRMSVTLDPHLNTILFSQRCSLRAGFGHTQYYESKPLIVAIIVQSKDAYISIIFSIAEMEVQEAKGPILTTLLATQCSIDNADKKARLF